MTDKGCGVLVAAESLRFRIPNSALRISQLADNQLVTQNKRRRVPWSGVDVLNAAQVRLVVLQGVSPSPLARNSITPSRETIQSGKYPSRM